MSLKKVLREKHVVEEYVVGATCNVCGKEGQPSDGTGWPAGFHVWDLEGGWGDHFPGDLERFQIVVCEDCLRAWVGGFLDPDISVLHRVSGPTEILNARHSETGEILTVKHGWAFPEGVTEPEGDADDCFLNDMEFPPEGTVWQHFNGNRYLIKDYAFLTDTGEPLVIYQGLYGDSDVWAMPLEMWSGNQPDDIVPRFVRTDPKAT